MSLIFDHLSKNSLHHAYLIEGDREKIVPEILEFLKSLGIEKGNPDFFHIELDSFKIDDARNLKSYATEKGFSMDKKVFLISANSFLLEAQNSLLKLFEEPIENTHFFVVTPDTNSLLKTLVSRFYFISTRQDLIESKEADKFIVMHLNARINFLKDFLATENEDEDVASADSNRAKSLRFLNALELNLHQKLVSKTVFDTGFFEHLFKVREFLRMPGSSAKTLMESVAIIIPVL